MLVTAVFFTASADPSPTSRLFPKTLSLKKLPIGYLKTDYGLLKEHLSHQELKLTGVEWIPQK